MSEEPRKKGSRPAPEGMQRFAQAENGDPADPDTGETIEGFVAVLQRRAKNGFSDGWLAMSQSAILEIAKNKELGADTLRVFLALASYLDFDNWIQVSQVEIGKAVGMHRQHVQRAVKRLISLEVLIEGPRSGVHRTYRLNPTYGWKGSAKGHRQALEEQRKARTEAAARRSKFKVIDGGPVAGPAESDEMFEVEGQGQFEFS